MARHDELCKGVGRQKHMHIIDVAEVGQTITRCDEGWLKHDEA